MTDSKMSRPTVADLTGDNPIAQLAHTHWLTKSSAKVLPEVVNELWEAVEADTTPPFALLLLEQLQALERYLWPGYTDACSNQHVLLLALLVNVKRQEHLPVWTLFADRPDDFSSFFRRITHMSIDQSLSIPLRKHLLLFLVGAFQSLDSGIVRKECAPLVSIGTWHHLHSERAREKLLAKNAAVQKAWRAAGKKYDNTDAAGQARLRFERSWLYTLALDFLDKLYTGEESADRKNENTLYCERFVELLCDLLSQLPTRRYVNALQQDLNMISAIKLSPLYQDGDESTLLRNMTRLLEHYTYFPVDDQTGKELTQQEYEDAHNVRISRLQKVALKLHAETLKILVLANYGLLSQRAELLSHLQALDDDQFVAICDELLLRTSYPEKSLVVQDRAFFNEVLASTIEQHPLYSEGVRSTAILPTEGSLYELSSLHADDYNGSRPLAIPKLNLQYLTLGDFLWRAFCLFRAEAFFEIRKHIEETIKRIQPRLERGSTRFEGFSKMAIPISKPAIIQTQPPRVGEDVPGEVQVEVSLDVSRLQPGLRREWESFRQDDVVYLLAVQPAETEKRLTNGLSLQTPAEKAGVKVLRCAEVIHILDDQGRALRRDQIARGREDEFDRPKKRRLLLRLDAAAYHLDRAHADAGKGDVLDSINVVVRRTARENNFKPVLESIKQMTLSNDIPVPGWLRDVFLGFGDPASASYKRLPNRQSSMDYRDTFLDWQHLIETMSGKTVEPDPGADASFPPPYVLESVGVEPVSASRKSKKRRHDQPDGPEPAKAIESVRVSTYTPPSSGPYPTDAPKVNAVRFTPSQVEAITSGTQPGLTVIVGPPGTGKTDVATQIISNIYHNHPQQRILLVAHSNQALNQLFQKIVALDIDERHLLRLGHGEEELTTDANFSKAGRVDSFLERGSRYLYEVQRLAASIAAPGAHGNSCETAEYFDQVYVRPQWKKFWDEMKTGQAEPVQAFPFQAFFADAPQPLFPGNASRGQQIEIAQGCERHIRKIFDQLAHIRPFEILRHQKDKSNYLLVKEARIVAMTSTHAAMRRQEIVNQGFKYDNIIMEESAQITEAESFIPLAMQDLARLSTSNIPAGLQRIILVGDHLQNAPVIQHAAFRSYAHLDQSLFQRLIRLGVPHITLTAQGRSRPTLAELYKWRYPALTNLPFTSTAPEFVRANAGFRYEYQFLDVGDYKGKGETEPSKHFVQNLGEAEYAVALFQYMRLLGYPAEKISILTAYAGQRALIRDVLAHRCKGNRLFGLPGWVGTVDKYQGEQNDYIILSLTRTKAPGYLRDLRRLTVALSRARLGFYVLGRREVFESSLELGEAFRLLFERSERLEVVTGEMFPASRGVADGVEGTVIEGVEHLGKYVFEMTQAKVEALREGGGVAELADGEGGAGGGEEDGGEEDADGVDEADQEEVLG
ncbi:hypothetical protein LTR62_008373 [Meristemomyces frigidus]|uniref:Pre-mRNA-splicing factor n=1 Tax=Meristemomyces frigidus TaxID=1508187 RepID=A0AAN7TDG1_9PEZI|nr:hypothetical protein LTR62_008373 [Meristemomyces frigidus]